MPSKKETTADSVESLLGQLSECRECAQAQEEISELQDANARKMAKIGDALLDHAVTLNGQIEMEAARTSPPIIEVPGAFRQRARRRSQNPTG